MQALQCTRPGWVEPVEEGCISNLQTMNREHAADVNNVFLPAGPLHSGLDLRAACPRLSKRAERYGHRPAVVLSRSSTLRSSLEQALFARGAAVANLRTLPAVEQVQDLLASGLIVLAPPSRYPKPDDSAWIAAADVASTDGSVNAVMAELERRGVLFPREFLLPGEGI